jgi:hypothetical protein
MSDIILEIMTAPGSIILKINLVLNTHLKICFFKEKILIFYVTLHDWHGAGSGSTVELRYLCRMDAHFSF